eukprot:2335784-Rhodomonas_salina.1
MVLRVCLQYVALIFSVLTYAYAATSRPVLTQVYAATSRSALNYAYAPTSRSQSSPTSSSYSSLLQGYSPYCPRHALRNVRY